MLNNLPQIRLKLLQNKQIKKTAEVTGDLIGNKIANKTTKVSQNTQHNNSENDKQILKEIYISPKERQEIIDELRLKQYNNRTSKNLKSFKTFTTK